MFRAPWSKASHKAAPREVLPKATGVDSPASVSFLSRLKTVSYQKVWIVPAIIYVLEILYILYLGQRFLVVWYALAVFAVVALLTYGKWVRTEILLSVIFVASYLIALSGASIPWVSWFGVIPPYVGMIFIIDQVRSRRALFWYGFWIGLMVYSGISPWAWFSVGRFWNPDGNAPPLGVMLLGPFFVFFILTALIGLQLAISMVVAGHLHHRLRAAPLPALFALVYVLVEYWFPVPFAREPACLIALQPMLLQMIDIVGARGYTIVACLMAGGIYVLLSPRERRNRRQVYAWTAILILVPLFQVTYGAVKMRTLAPKPGDETIDVAMIQPCTPLHIRNKDRKANARAALELLRLSREVVRAGDRPPDLLVWPEGAGAFSYEHPLFNPEYVNAIHVLQSETSVTLLTSDIEFIRPPKGMPFNNETVKYRYLNHVSLIDPDGSLTGQYVKVTRLPFTEYLPCEQVLISMERYSLARYLRAMYRKTFPGVRSVGEGFEHTLLYTPKAPLAAPICYEIIFEKPIREFTQMGARLLVNVANDEWFRSDEEKKQHFMTGILRSVENRLPLIRATNTGLSAIVDARGVVGPSDQAPMNRQAVLRANVSLPSGESFYTRAGYRFPGWILTPIFLALWVRASVRARRRSRIEKAAKGREFPDRKKKTRSKRSRA